MMERHVIASKPTNCKVELICLSLKTVLDQKEEKGRIMGVKKARKVMNSKYLIFIANFENNFCWIHSKSFNVDVFVNLFLSLSKD